jgi:hypothetical protein
MRRRLEEWREYFNKSKNLVITGANNIIPSTSDNLWFWRDGEISLRNFMYMDKEEQNVHISFLLNLPIEERSTNDESILQMYVPRYSTSIGKEKINDLLNMAELDKSIKKQIKGVINLNEYVDVGAISFSIEEIQQKDVHQLKEELDIYFENIYPDWETNVRFHSIEKFLTNTRNFMEICEQGEAHIRQYKLLKSKS